METPWGVFEEILKQFKWRVEGLPMVRGRLVTLSRPQKRSNILDCRILFGSKELGRLRLHKPENGAVLIVWKRNGTQVVGEHMESIDLHAPDAAGVVCEMEGMLLTPVQVADRLADSFMRFMQAL